ncbi:hypothetical protein H0A66_15915 [Alcaligenaceae bacterium]|nr:hypothetical protein [Alcaligenaceae bacterium]
MPTPLYNNNEISGLDGMMAIAALVEHGLGISLLPDWAPMWRSALNIARIPLPYMTPIRKVGVIWNRRSPRATLTQTILAALTEIAHMNQTTGRQRSY